MKPKKMIETMKKKLAHIREQCNFEDDYVPNSISYTKLELPIHYSNLVYIEDMQIENSTYFITANGFVSKKIYLSSSKHDKKFNMSNCVFRIYPKTYNVNKDKVKDCIDSQSKSLGDELQELHFKFSAEMFNNLDIIQNKFGEPVRYGDIIMLLHESSRMFVEFNSSSKTIRLSNHDSDATLFLIEPAKEIMLNDNQILKTGQPIKLKIAGFSYAEKSLYFGLRFPYMNNNILLQSNEKTDLYRKRTTFRQRANEAIQILDEDDEGNEDPESHRQEEKVYDEEIKKYIQEPEIIVEETTSMKWRFLLFTTFTTNENLLIYGDFVQLFHCNSSSVLGINISENTIIEAQLNDLQLETINNNAIDRNTMKSTHSMDNKDKDKDNNDREKGEDEIENILTLIDQSISQIDNEDEIIPLNNLIKTTFKLETHSMFSYKQDVDSTWVLVSIFPTIKHQSFIRYYDETKIDTYHMIFRIKNFKTNQILTIQQINENEDDDALLGTVKGKQVKGLMDGCQANNGKVYKFVLIDDINEVHKTAKDTEILSEDYQYSLFGFKKSMKALSYYSSRPEKNDFVYLYHITTKSYLSIIPSSYGSCNLTLVKYPDEREVFKVFTVSPKSQWEYRFLKNLFTLLNFVISKIQIIKELTESAITKTMMKILTTTHFILDNLNKFTMNLFINKFVYDSGYNSVVNSRQLLILNFGFTKVFLRNFIYYYWMRNNMEEMNKLNDLLSIKKTKQNYSLSQDNEITFSMFSYTQSIFDFMIFYCKDNEEIKNELYANLDVFFYFFNLIESCLYGMIEIFKNNEKILISLIRDCTQNPKFKTALYTIGTTYFGNKHDDYDNYNLIDLIFDYIEISKYENDARNNINKEHSLNSKAVSLLSREKYFELLKALVNNQKGTNILENQREIINKIITKKRDNSDAYMFKEFIFSKVFNKEEGEFEENTEVLPCLKELLYSLSNQNPDDKIHFFIQTHDQFTIDKLFPDKKKRIDNETLAANIKWIMYFFPSNDHLSSLIDPEEDKKTELFNNQIKQFYYEVVNQLKNLSNTIDFSNRSQVNLINSFLCLLKKILEKNTAIDFNNIQFSNVTGILLSFLTRKYQRIINDTQNISNLIHGEMNEKKIILKQRIIKSDHSQYISIAESWLNVYLVFKFYLLKRLEDTSIDNEYSTKLKSNNDASLDKTNFQVSENKNLLLTQKEEDNTKTVVILQNFDENEGGKTHNKADMSFYTKDELINYNKSKFNIGGYDDYFKGTGPQQSALDMYHSKTTKFVFSELNNAASKSQHKRIFSEDENIKNMYEVSKNIIDILKLTIKQNITVLNDNFYNYYNSLTYSPNKPFELNDFIEHCVPDLDSCIHKVNTLIKTFKEKKLHSQFKRYNELTNLNSVYEDKEESKDLNLNFIQSLINVFNFSEDIEMQESILDLIYVFFNQRRRFFNSVVMFNEHLSDFSNIKYNPFNNKDKIKSHFKKFYYSYEKTKQEYEVKTIDYFLTFLLLELINIFKKILKYWKNEFRILSLAYTNKYCQNMEVNELMILKIEKVLDLLLEQKENISKPIFDTLSYLDYIDVLIQIVYFIRINVDNPLFNSLITILNEDGGMFNKMYFSLINDFISKGKELSEWYSSKRFMFFKVVRDESSEMVNYSIQEIHSFKNKYYSALFMLITLQTVSLPRNDKTLNYLHQILLNEKKLLKYDSFSAFLILLSISDLQKGSLTLDYFFIMEKINELNNNRCEENIISPVLQEQLPNSFTQLYVDIMLNVLKFIVLKDTMINEINLDEIVVDNFLYLVKKISFTNNTKGKLKLTFIKLVNYFHEIPSLYKIYQTKTRQDAVAQINIIPITLFFPTPLELYPLFRKHFDQINFNSELKDSANIIINNSQLKKKETKKKQIDQVKRAFSLYKYILFYCLEIDPKYFDCTELFDNQQVPYNWLKKIIVTGIAGKENININPNLNSNSSGMENESSNELKSYFQSSFFYLINCYSFNQIDKNKEFMDQQNPIFQVEGLFLSELEQMDFFMQKKYVKSVGNSDRDIKIVEEERESEKQIFYSTGTDEKVCLYVFNKLTKYDQNIDNADIYKRIYKNLNLKSMKVKADKMHAFKSMLWRNADALYGFADNETSSMIFYLLILLDAETTMQYDEIFLTFINKIAEYISVGFSKSITPKRVKLTSFLLFIIIEILKFFEENESVLINHTIRKKTLREAQIMFLKTSIIEKCLSLVCKYNIPEMQILLPNVFEMFCRLLKKGNYNSQEVFYNLFTTKSKFEPVFSFMLEVISKQINHILSNKAFIIRHRKKQLSFEKKLSLRESFEIKLDSKILQFLQLLCENHNRKLQIYLHYQSNFRKSYDLVSQTQNYLNIIANYFEPFLFESLTKCFDLLIEFVQGPCIENQIALINSKVLITLNEILQCYVCCEKEVLDKEFPERNMFDDNENQQENEEQLYLTTLMKMTTQQISLLTFKSSILLHALIENRTKEDNIYFTIKSVVKAETVKCVYSKIFFEHLMLLVNSNDLNDYDVKLKQFNRAGDVEESAKTEKVKIGQIAREPVEVEDYLILETGFLLYFLYMYYQDFDANKEQMIRTNKGKSLINQVSDTLSGTFFDLFVSLYLFVYHFSLSILQTITFIISGCIFACSIGKIKLFNLMRKMFKHQSYNESHCNKFYEKYTESIEILRDDVVYRIYFYILPYFKKLNRFEKTRFLEEIDRTNSKTKLTEIIKFADKKRYELEFDYKIKAYSTYIPILGVLFNSVDLWKDISLILNLIQNFFNIFAVYKVGQTSTLCFLATECVDITNWVDEKSFFRMTHQDFTQIIRIMSYIQCGLVILIFVEYICRTIPAIYKTSKEEVNRTNEITVNRHLSIAGQFIKSLLINSEFLYYCCYLIFAFLGTFNSDFFFAFLLLEIIQRFKTLRNVLKAIKNPYKQLFMTFCLWIIVIYFFAIFGYAFFRTHFDAGACSSLVRCVATIFYQNNKMDNGIGGYLKPIYEEPDKTLSWWVGRFFYDELFNLLLKILVIQMISGIIIDNFALLRVQEMDMLDDMENRCTICGLKREDIEKIYDKYGKTYQDHISDHRIFNYIFYIIYLCQKDKTEFTGVESYVYELAYNQKDITWFPIDNLYIAKKGELEMDNEEESND